MKARLIKSGLAAVVAVGGMLAMTATSASAHTPTITAGAGSSVSCQITGSAKLVPPIKNDWTQSQHSSDPDPAVVAIPDTVFAANGPVTTTAKGAGTCSGNVTDGVNTASVTTVKFTLATDPAHPGSGGEATCAGLLGTAGTAEYNITIKWTATGAKVTPTTITDATLAVSGLGFALSGGTVAGSFAGGSVNSQANVDSTTIGAILQAPATSSNPDPAFPQCQPALDLKTSKGVQEASLDAPKGLKKIGITTNSSNQPSTIDASVPAAS